MKTNHKCGLKYDVGISRMSEFTYFIDKYIGDYMQ